MKDWTGTEGLETLRGSKGPELYRGLNVWILEKGQWSETATDYMTEIGLRSVPNPVQVWVGVL